MVRPFNSMLGINVFGRELNQDDIDNNIHREVVGGKWETLGRLQCEFLVSQGLKPHHKLLDIGCGCLRGGIHFIQYLEANNYYGLDVNRSLVYAGYREVEIVGLSEKKPNLMVDSRFRIYKFGVKFDFMISTSLFTHLPVNNIVRCLISARQNLKPNGIYYSSYWEAPEPAYLKEIQFPDGIKTSYDADPYHISFDELKWMAETSGLSIDFIGEWGHPRHQKMAAFRNKNN